MQIFSRLYQKALDWAQSKYAIYWLSIVSFLESSILPYPPPDVILAPMSLKQPNKAYYYAFICTLTSVLGGLVGYFLGEVLLKFLLMYALVSPESIELVKYFFNNYGVLIVAIAAFSPIPYKLATITAGSVPMALMPFIIVSFIARGARYFLIAFLVRKFGKQTDMWLQKYIDRLGYVLIIIVILGIWYVN
jgi:membrane protein YqaA with SNARE-associated domain